MLICYVTPTKLGYIHTHTFDPKKKKKNQTNVVMEKEI